MKKGLKLFGIIALVAVIGFSMIACDDSGSSSAPNSRLIEWTQSSENYSLSLTELTGARSASKNYTYILSVGTSGFSTGTSEIDGDDYTLTPRDSGSSAVTLKIDGSTNQVTTTSAQSITLTKEDGSTTSASIPVTDATATITDNTGGASDNPFVGTWKYGPAAVKVNKNLTWVYTEPGFKMSGSYAFIGTAAIIYESNGDFFGFALVSGNSMYCDTFNGEYTFTK